MHASWKNRDILLLPPTDSVREKLKTRIEKIKPDIEIMRIGRSVLGREIELYKIGKGSTRVAYFGAHHALEAITSSLLYALILTLAEASEGILTGEDGDTVRGQLERFSYYVAPTVNPDGVELFYNGIGDSPLAERIRRMSGGDLREWQSNARGVDLNHNYQEGFSEYKRLEIEDGIRPGATRYSGEYPESEPESRAAAALVRALAPSLVLSLHSQGEEIFFGPHTQGVTAAAERLAELTGYTLSTPEGSARYGGLCDYTAALGIPSFTVEVGRGKNPLSHALLPELVDRLLMPLVMLPSFV